MLVSTVGHLVPPIDSLQALELELLSFPPLFLLLFHIYLPGTLNLWSMDHQGSVVEFMVLLNLMGKD